MRPFIGHYLIDIEMIIKLNNLWSMSSSGSHFFNVYYAFADQMMPAKG
jgi:hypothetical protein